ncbi:MAG: GNAT family protein [Bacteroidota bacterium]
MSKWLNEVALQGDLVRLELLDNKHEDGLRRAVQDGNLWELWYTSSPHPDEAAAYIQTARHEYEADRSLPFAVIHKASDKVIGTTRYMNAVAQNKRLEIGTTWYAQSFQRTGINTECKFLLLQYAFETLDCIAVEFRTHWYNFRSRAAIARLGAKQDGVLRNHSFDKTGNIRDTVVFSILRSEWKVVQQSLQFKMNKTY